MATEPQHLTLLRRLLGLLWLVEVTRTIETDRTCLLPGKRALLPRDAVAYFISRQEVRIIHDPLLPRWMQS
jgi:hypothetical protein